MFASPTPVGNWKDRKMCDTDWETVVFLALASTHFLNVFTS